MLDVATRTAEECFIPYTVGGGMRSADDIRAMLAAGADKISLNSAAVRDPSLITHTSGIYGAQCIVTAIDARRVPGSSPARWEVFINGGRINTELDAVRWAAEAERLGSGEILLTSMDCDGTKDGYDIDLTRAVTTAVNVPVIAEGSLMTPEDCLAVLEAGAYAVVVGAAITAPDKIAGRFVKAISSLSQGRRA